MTEPYAAFAATLLAHMLVAAWAFGEAVALPVVPDVLLGLLVVAAPHQAPLLLATAIVAGVLGSVALWTLLRHRPALARAILARQPGLGEPGLDEARRRLVTRGRLRGFAQVGPGLPLKAYLATLHEVAPATGYAEVSWLASVNRLTRIGPVVVAFVLAAPLVSGVDLDPVLFGVLYFTGWAVFYAAYWINRAPRRRSSAQRRGGRGCRQQD